jgi:ATP-binding cassette subfamily C protein EexD
MRPGSAMQSGELRKSLPSPIVAILGEMKWPIVLLFLVGFMVNVLQLTGSVYMMQVYDRVLASQSEATLLALTVISIFLILLYAILEGCRSFALIGLGRMIDRRLSSRVFEVLFVQGSLKGSDRVGVQPLRDLEQIRSFISTNGLTTSLDVPWIPVFILILYILHPLFAAFGAVAVLLVIGNAIVQALLSTKKLAEASNTNVRAYSFLEASIRNAETAEAMGMRTGVWRRWQQRHLAMLKQQEEASKIAGGFSATIKFLQLTLTGVLTLGLGALLVIEQAVTPGTMIVATFILARALAPSMQVVALWQQAMNARAAHRRLCEFMLAAPVQKQGMELPTPQGSLSVENLVLSIPGTDNLVLRGVSFVLPAGESLAVIGPSAAGKSTLARGLLGIWPPRAGAVRLDGADLSRMAREHVGKHLGYLPQDVELFEGTVAENIARLGEVDAEKVVASAKTAGLHDLILHLPDGYDTPLGPGGRGLSPGQRQRIGLARALYGEPRFVVLDEPNSNLDSEGEAALAAALERLRAARITTVIITHRANILAAVDKILLMRAGQVEAFGRRDDILPKLTRPAQSPRPVAAIGNN